MSKFKKIIISILIIILSVGIVSNIIPEIKETYIVEASNVKINKTKKTMYVGDTYKLKISGTKKKVKWSSSNRKVAKVTSKGKVIAVKKGKCTITAKVGKKRYRCNVTVKKVAKNTSTNTSTTNNSSKNGVIYLTFDDGPSSNITPKVLDILKEENVKATFFVLNYSSANEKLIKRIVNEGHTIAIHGYSHDYAKIYKSKKAFWNNVYTLQEKIEKSTGVKSKYIRFPGGSSNTVSRKYNKGIMTELSKEALNKGFKYYDWNVSSGDAGGAKNANAVYNNVTKNLSKKRGNMVLMHDFASNKKGLEALPRIINYAKTHGYTFSSIDDSTPMYAQHINN